MIRTSEGLALGQRGYLKMSNLLLKMGESEHIATVNAVSEEGITWILQYHILTMQGVADEVLYGLKIDKCTLIGEIIESESTYAVTEDYKVAKEIATAFANGMVFPITLAEMIDEWFDEDVA